MAKAEGRPVPIVAIQALRPAVSRAIAASERAMLKGSA